MKKIIKFFFFLLMLGIATTSYAQIGSSDDMTPSEARNLIKEGIAELNTDLPEQVDEDMWVESIKLVDNELAINFLALVDDEIIQVIEIMKDEFSLTMYDSLKEEPDTKELFDLCKIAKINLVFNFKNANSTSCKLVIPYTKMK